MTADLGSSRWFVRYGTAALFVLAALGLNSINPAQSLPFTFFYAAVALSARVCGYGAALFSTVLSAAVVDFFLLPPRFSFALDRDNLLRTLFFGLVALLISSLARQKSKMQKLADEVRRQRAAIVESSEDAIFNKTLDGVVLTWNHAAERLYGYKPEEIIGKNVATLAPPERVSEIDDILQRLKRGERIAHFETERVTKDGRRLNISLAISPVLDEQGTIVEAATIARDISERKRAEDQIKLLVEAAPAAMVMVDEHGKIVLINRLTETLFGYERNELIGQSIEQLVPDKFRHHHEQYRTAFAADAKQRAMGIGRDLYGLRKDGTEVPVEIGLNPIRTAEGLFVVAAITDISERKRAEDQIKLLVEAAPAAMVMIDEHGKIVLINRLTEQLFGYERNELIGTSIEQLVPHKFRRQHEQYRTTYAAAPQQRAMGAGRDLYGLRKDGTEFPVEIGLNPIRTAEGLFVVAAITDISERKRAEKELRESENKLRLFIEHAPAAMAMFDRNMRYLAVSHRWLHDFGLNEDVIGRSHYEIFPEIPERWKDVHRRCLAGAVEKSDDDEFKRSDGSVQWLKWEVRPWFESGGKIGGLVIFSEDISERKKVEELLRRTEKLAAVGQLGATIAHELNNPLESVTNLAYLIRKNKSLDEKAQRQIEALDQELARMADMTRRTLGFYRDTSSAVPVLPTEIMDEVLALYARRLHSKSVELKKEYETGAEVMAFVGEIRKVFSNLIANAIDAVGNRGRITIRIRNSQDWRNHGVPGVRITVADSGSGISPKDKPRIFEPLYTTKTETGTGLGLWLSKDIVQSHRGSISVHSSGRSGTNCKTAFSVFLPASAAVRLETVAQEQQTA